jgi:glycosyltransferase involved in cell wall biosynthesis
MCRWVALPFGGLGLAKIPVAIDGFNLALAEGTGVATYARQLARNLRALGGDVGVIYGRPSPATDDVLLREIQFFDPPLQKRGWLKNVRTAVKVAKGLSGFAAQEVGTTGRVILGEFAQRLPEHDRLFNAESLFAISDDYYSVFKTRLEVRLPLPPKVMHWTYPLPLRVAGAKNIYTLHDLVPLRLPHTTLDRKRRYLNLMRRLTASADHIVTVSEASRRDIVDLLKVPEDRVTNTYQAVSVPPAVAAKSHGQLRRELESGFGLQKGGYYLFFGAIEPKKNVGRLIQAYLASGVTAPLLLVGKRAWKSEQELRLLNLSDDLRRLGNETNPHAHAHVTRRIVQVDYAPYGMLMTLVRGARAVLFPSLYEGFGLPVLEAMSLGTPVIASTTSSLPEVAGSAALLVDPYDVAALCEAILAVDAKAELRARLSAAGLKQAALFSEAAYQVRLRDLYARLGVDFD